MAGPGFTRTQIANRALTMLGAETVDDIDAASSKAARAIRNVWEQVCSEVQAEDVFPDLRRRVSIDRHPDKSSDELYRYALPPNVLRIVAVNPSAIYDVYHRIEGEFIVTNQESPIILDYTALITDPGSWDVHLAHLMATALSAEVALVISDSLQIEQTRRADYMQALKEARFRSHLNATSGLSQKQRTGWIDSRRLRS